MFVTYRFPEKRGIYLSLRTRQNCRLVAKLCRILFYEEKKGYLSFGSQKKGVFTFLPPRKKGYLPFWLKGRNLRDKNVLILIRIYFPLQTGFERYFNKMEKKHLYFGRWGGWCGSIVLLAGEVRIIFSLSIHFHNRR